MRLSRLKPHTFDGLFLSSHRSSQRAFARAVRFSTVGLFLKNAIKSAANIILRDENNENTHKTYLGAIVVSGEKGISFGAVITWV